MLTHRIGKLACCFILAILSIVVLFLSSSGINNRKNGFIRLFPPHRLDYIRSWKLTGDRYYLAGWNNEGFYLVNTEDPNSYLLIDNASANPTNHTLKFQKRQSKLPQYLSVNIDSQSVSVFEGITPILWSGQLDSLDMSRQRIDSTHFLSAIPISVNSWIVKTYDRNLSQIVLLKKSFLSGNEPNPKYVLEKNEEGVFSPDGILKFDPILKHLYFIYFYKNKFICLDTNLKTIYTGKTIDTTQHPVLKILTADDKRMTSIAGNSLLVNKTGAISRNNLFIESKLLANNENKQIFDRTSVIDIYDKSNGRYRYSFYIPNFQDESLREFKVRENLLIALYDHYLVLYRLNYLSA